MTRSRTERRTRPPSAVSVRTLSTTCLSRPALAASILALAAWALPSTVVADEAAWKSAHEAGWAAFEAGRLPEAEASLAAAARELKAFPKDDPRIPLTLDHLAWAYLARGKFDLAEPLARFALAVRQKNAGPESHETAQSVNTLACLCDAQGKFDEAEPLYRRALAVEERARGLDHPNVAALLDNLATVCHARRKDAEAEAAYRRALAIREKAPEADLVPTLLNLAALHLDAGDPVKAEPLLKRALRIREAALGPKDPGVVECLDALARVARAMGRLDEARAYSDRALAILDERAADPSGI
jgi:tetratricopeptide (TPR) repeat protein